MTDTTTPRHRSQITGNAGLNYAKAAFAAGLACHADHPHDQVGP